jgi:UDP-glucose 4-epimerase
VFDFYKQLRENPKELKVLGDGRQRKSYLYIGDCLSAMLRVIEKARERLNIYNLGTDEYCEVNDSIAWICEHLDLSPKLVYSGGKRGWVGDNPFIFLDCTKVKSLGWRAELSIREAILRTVTFIDRNQWILSTRR